MTIIENGLTQGRSPTLTVLPPDAILQRGRALAWSVAYKESTHLTEEEVAGRADLARRKIIDKFDLLPGEYLLKSLPDGARMEMSPNHQMIWMEGPAVTVVEGAGTVSHRSIAKVTFTPEGAIVEGIDISKSIDSLPTNSSVAMRFFQRTFNDLIDRIEPLGEGPFSKKLKYLTGEQKVIKGKSKTARRNTDFEFQMHARIHAGRKKAT